MNSTAWARAGSSPDMNAKNSRGRPAPPCWLPRITALAPHDVFISCTALLGTARGPRRQPRANPRQGAASRGRIIARRTIRVRAAFLDAVLDGKFDAGSAELTGPGAPSTKWCALR